MGLISIAALLISGAATAVSGSWFDHRAWRVLVFLVSTVIGWVAAWTLAFQTDKDLLIPAIGQGFWLSAIGAALGMWVRRRYATGKPIISARGIGTVVVVCLAVAAGYGVGLTVSGMKQTTYLIGVEPIDATNETEVLRWIDAPDRDVVHRWGQVALHGMHWNLTIPYTSACVSGLSAFLLRRRGRAPSGENAERVKADG
ncbi:hypothetical protein [Aureimonas sp. AU40]|uniref:hypothetical protein n=1 Tax=Aureimonas sp. AU40 TaxID=1637747 RepID=UPI00078061F0|nr:hypothetical protein [Aureimonas sp. AU40]